MDEATYERFDSAEGFQARCNAARPAGTRAARVRSRRRGAAPQRLLARRRARALPRREPHATLTCVARHRPPDAALPAHARACLRATRTPSRSTARHEHIREIQDAFLVLDSQHYVRRPVASFYRGAIGLGDEPGRSPCASASGDLGSVLSGRSSAPPPASKFGDGARFSSGTEPEFLRTELGRQ